MTTTAIPLIEALRTDLHARIDKACDEAIAQLSPNKPANGVIYKQPTLADGHDPRNKNGQNLTPRGAEILYRVFDDGGGYNRAAKMLGISQGAAKNRKGNWLKEGGLNRTKLVLDIDSI
jgi:DNA invertase Pin-like site-specific DNA recombinase